MQVWQLLDKLRGVPLEMEVIILVGAPYDFDTFDVKALIVENDLLNESDVLRIVADV